MELREAIDKLFEMTDEQRSEEFGFPKTEDVLDTYHMGDIIRHIEEFCKPKYGDVYENKFVSSKIVFLRCSSGEKNKVWVLHSDDEIPQLYNMSTIDKSYTKTGKNVADELKELFK